MNLPEDFQLFDVLTLKSLGRVRTLQLMTAPFGMELVMTNGEKRTVIVDGPETFADGLRQLAFYIDGRDRMKGSRNDDSGNRRTIEGVRAQETSRRQTGNS